MAATAKYIILKNLVFNIMIEIDISIVSIFITTKQKTIESAELDFSIVLIVFNSQSENYCNYNYWDLHFNNLNS